MQIEERPRDASGERRRVLVVDDNRDTLETFAELLVLLGHQVQCAEDGEAAIAIASQFHPDVVLLDLGLPTISGIEVARRLRNDAIGAPLTLAAITGWGQDGDVVAEDVGFDFYVVKPVSLDVLRRIVGDARRPTPGPPRARSSRH